MIRFMKAAIAGVKQEYSFGIGHNPWGVPSTWIKGSFGSTAGKTVNAGTAMEIAAVWACVRKTSEMIASLPIDHYRKGPNDSRERLSDNFAEIIKESPNPEQTAAEFWEGMTAQTMLQGNAYAEKLFIGARLVGLRPLPSCTAERDRDGALQYSLVDRGRKEILPAQKVFHLRGFGAGDGLGMSTVRYGANSMGAALAADETASAVFANRAMPSGILTSEQTLNPEQRGQLQSMIETFTGSNKAGKMMALEAGLSYKQLQMNPEDAQLLETRRFSVEDVCRWFGVPPIIVGHAAQGQTMWGTGVEAILLGWLTTGINPFLVRLEQRVRKDLMTPTQRRREYVEYNREAMIQMDSKAKGDLLQKLAMSGTMTANERRAKLNLPRHIDPNADALLAQTAMAPLANLGKETT